MKTKVFAREKLSQILNLLSLLLAIEHSFLSICRFTIKFSHHYNSFYLKFIYKLQT